MSPPVQRRRARTFTTRKLTDDEREEVKSWTFVQGATSTVDHLGAFTRPRLTGKAGD